jgi:hypothetical protein
MAVRSISFADKNLISQIAPLEVLKPHVPRLAEYEEGMAAFRSMQSEITQLGRITRRAGFSQDMSLQHVARIPVSVKAAIEYVDEEAFTNKKKFYELLNPGGPLEDYDVRGKIIL